MASSVDDPIRVQIEDLQRFVQGQHDLFLMQQKQALQLRHDLQQQLDACLRRTNAVLQDTKNRQYVQRLIIAQQHAQQRAAQENARIEQEHISALQAPIDTVVASQSALADQVAALSAQLHALTTAHTATSPITSTTVVTSSDAELLASALGDNNEGVPDTMRTATEDTLIKTLETVQASQDAIHRAIEVNLPKQLRVAFDQMLATIVATLDQAVVAQAPAVVEAEKPSEETTAVQ